MISKRGIFILVLVSLLSVSLISASWFSDAWGKMNGQAISRSVTLPACVDSDSGISPNVEGTISYGKLEAEDKCISDELLNELYCTVRGVQSVTYNCQLIGKSFGCVQSEAGIASCVNLSGTNREDFSEMNLSLGSNRSAMNKSCHDSDGGMKEYMAGVLTGGSYGTVRYNHGPFKDYCSGLNQVEEYYCTTGDYVQVHSIMCSNGCRNGACLATVPKKGFFARMFGRQ